MAADEDYRKAVEELDREFPGAGYDESLEAYKAEQGRIKKIKIFILRRGIYFLIGIGLLLTAVKIIPAAIIIICLCLRSRMT